MQTTVTNGKPTTTTVPAYGLVPHTRPKYTYEVQKWVHSRKLVASGNNRNTSWPSYMLDASICERVYKTEERYVVRFQSAKGTIYERELPEADWVALDDNNFLSVDTHYLWAGHVSAKRNPSRSCAHMRNWG